MADLGYHNKMLDSYLSGKTAVLMRYDNLAEYCKTIEHLAKPFVENGIYESTAAFVSDLLKDVATRKIRAYERKIKRFEEKYGTFIQFSQKIRNKATPWQENQWMEWEAAINMLSAWKTVTNELDTSAS
jgi:hypothetical protein